MVTRRYAVRRESQDIGWSVYDVFTGLIATHRGEFLHRLDHDEAVEFAEILNALDHARRLREGRV
jgi:hypothetical protein